MSNISTAKLEKKATLLAYYEKELKKAFSEAQKYPLKDGDQVCWVELSYCTAQLVGDVGVDDAARMFDEWACELRKGRFVYFDCRGMTRLSAATLKFLRTI